MVEAPAMSAHPTMRLVNAFREVTGRAVAASLVVGGTLGVLMVWLLRPESPACTTTETGLRACMPVVVVPPPLWVYFAFGAAGALAGLLLAAIALHVRRQPA